MNKSFFYALAVLFAFGVTASQSQALSSNDLHLTADRNMPQTAHADGKTKDGMTNQARKGFGQRDRKNDRGRDRDRGDMTLFPSFGFGIGTGHGYRSGPAVDFGIGVSGETRRSYNRARDCDIKGIIKRDGRRVYYTPESDVYDDIDADRMFCSERQAERNGFRHSWR